MSSLRRIGVLVAIGSIGIMFTRTNDFHLPLLKVEPVSQWKPAPSNSNIHLPSIEKVPESSRKKILLPVAFNDFDPTEVSVPWYVLTSAGHTVVFASPQGAEQGRPSADQLVLDGYLFGILRAKPTARAVYDMMLQDDSFQNPLKYDDIVPSDYDGLILPGGHGPDSKVYLESTILQDKVRGFWELKRPVGAVCHGVLVLARAGVLNGVRTTAVTRDMERAAYHLTRAYYGRYHLTTTWPQYTQDIIEQSGAIFDTGPWNPIHTIWLGTAIDHRRSFVVEEGHYLSARFPGDVWTWALRFGQKLLE